MGLIILLILAGILLLLAEVFLIPGVGIAGVLGIASLVASCVYAFSISVTAGIIVIIVNILLVVGVFAFFMRGKTWKKFELNTVIDSKEPKANDFEAGVVGKSVTRLAPMGTARFGGKNVEVTSLEGMIDPETDIVIDRVEENKVFVKKAEKVEIN